MDYNKYIIFGLIFVFIFLFGCLKIKIYQDINSLGIANTTTTIKGIGNLMSIGKMTNTSNNTTTELTEKEICDKIRNPKNDSSNIKLMLTKFVIKECKYDKENDLLTLKTFGVTLSGNSSIKINNSKFTYIYKSHQTKGNKTHIQLNFTDPKAIKLMKSMVFEYDLYVTFPGKVTITNGEINETNPRKVHFDMLKIKEAKAQGDINQICFLPLGLIFLVGVFGLILRR